MRFRWLSYLLFTLPLVAGAKGETTRIEIASGKRPFVTLTGPDTAGQFTIWSGPGTTSAPGDGPGQRATSPRDFADWRAGAVEPPKNPAVFKVRFFCAAEQQPRPEVTPSHQCYGVRYAIDAETRQGYIQIPREGDREFPGNTRPIYRGVEGSWFRASVNWEMLVRPRMEAALSAANGDAYRYHEQPYLYTTPASHTAVGARTLVTPKK